MEKIPESAKKALTEAVRMRAKAKGLETEAKILINAAKDTLLPLMAAYDLSAYEVRGVGTVKSAVSTGASINRKKLTETLLIHGLDAETVLEVIKRSSSTWSTPYIKFKAEV